MKIGPISPSASALGSLRNSADAIERVIASARLFLVAASVIEFSVVPARPEHHKGPELVLLTVYLMFSVAYFIFLRLSVKAPSAMGLVAGLVDFGWATAMGFFTEGPTSSFFLFFTFVLLTYAYRWGLVRALGSGLLMVVVMIVQALAQGSARFSVPADRDRLLVRCAYLLILAWIAGFLAEQDRRNRRRAELVSEVLAHSQSQPDFPSTLRAVLLEVRHIVGAEESVLVLRNARSQKIYTWRQAGSRLRFREVGESPAELNSATEIEPASRNGASGQARRSLALDLKMIEGWSARLFLHAPRDPESIEILRTIAQEVAPAVQNVYITRQLHQQAGVAERARLARELHDGILQELAAISFEAEALRRSTDEAIVQAGLARIRDQVTTESLRLRQLIQQFRPVEISPKDLPSFLERVVDRFQRETGVGVSFVSTLQEDAAPPRVTREIARIAQEALVNIRKHSDAKHVVIRLESTAHFWRLEIDDDGSGFDFSGRQTLDELDVLRKGPIVIKERVRAIGAEMEVESAPGKGSRIEIRFPRHVEASAGR